MTFKKTGRRCGKCGDCNHFDKDFHMCNHPKHKELRVETDSIPPCGGNDYAPVDDYEKR